MTRKKIAIILGMSSLIGFFVLRWIQRKPTEADGAVEAGPKATSAQVVIVERGSIYHVLALAGQFQPYQVIDVHPKVSGFIQRIKVDIGDKVRQGQALAVLEVPELQAELKGTVAQVARSRNEIIRAQHEVDMAEAEYALGIQTMSACRQRERDSRALSLSRTWTISNQRTSRLLRRWTRRKLL